MSDSWQKQVDWMRANGVVSAKWSETAIHRPVQELTECILGPATEPHKELTAEEYKAQLEKQKADAEKALDDLDFGAS